MKRNKWNPRKVLIASAGLASVNYALAAGCNGNEPLVANLVACPPSQCPNTGTGGATVANLVAPPPGGNGFGAFGGTSADVPDADIADADAPDTDVPDADVSEALDAALDGSN
jgi:hypothetical protein